MSDNTPNPIAGITIDPAALTVDYTQMMREELMLQNIVTYDNTTDENIINTVRVLLVKLRENADPTSDEVVTMFNSLPSQERLHLIRLTGMDGQKFFHQALVASRSN